MGRLIIHEKDGSLELDGFLLQIGDQMELRILGSWLPGSIGHDKRGWYFLTPNKGGIRLHTGLLARALFLFSSAS